MTPDQMETMACAAFRRIFGREPDRSEGYETERGNSGAIATCSQCAVLLLHFWGSASASIRAPGRADTTFPGASPAAALRYAEAAYRRGKA